MFDRDALGLKDSADVAVQQTATEAKFRARSIIASALGRRASNALTDRRYPHPTKPLVVLLYSRWRRGEEDVLAAFETGTTIQGPLAIPLPSAGRYFRGMSATGRSTRQRITPEAWETLNNQDLHYVARSGRPPLLVAKRARLTGMKSGPGGLTGGVAVASKRKAGTGESPLWVPVFVLVRSVRMRSRFSLEPVRRFVEQRLGENFVTELGRRGVL
jgi:hypothetical protein